MSQDLYKMNLKTIVMQMIRMMSKIMKLEIEVDRSL